MNTSLLKYIGARDSVVSVVASAAEKKLSKVERTLLTCALEGDWSNLRGASRAATEKFFQELEKPETLASDTSSSSEIIPSPPLSSEPLSIQTGPDWDGGTGL